MLRFCQLVVVLSLAALHGATLAPKSLEDLRRSVLRITVYKRLFHWSRPYDDHDEVGSLGSGFVIAQEPPTVCTCAHVVAGADRVYVQVTSFGRTKFPARVATIDYDTDIALLLLPELSKLVQANVSLHPLRLADRTPALGHSVVAPGFPRGQKSLTLSTGIISGVNHVDFHHRNLALQSTAIISPGNSGSPLLDAESGEVVGMNYAKLSGEAQINYAVALWRLEQAIQKHHEVQAQNGREPYQFRHVDHGLVMTPGLDALYMMSRSGTACSNGPLISAIHPDSPFQDAVPPVSEESFLVSLDGVTLDRYGQGSKSDYVEELVDFDDLMMMRGGTGEAGVAFETCAATSGQVQMHLVNLTWRSDRQGRGIRYVHDARRDGVSWEIFGDLLFMDLSENHVKLSRDLALHRFLEPEERQYPRLAALLMRKGGAAEEALGLQDSSGLAIVESVNGHKVASLHDLRLHFMPANSSGASFLARRRDELLWSLRTEDGHDFAALFAEGLRSQAALAAEGFGYVLTPAAKAAMERLGLRPAAGPTAEFLGVGGVLQWMTGEFLEGVRRAPGLVVVDFGQGEDPNVW